MSLQAPSSLPLPSEISSLILYRCRASCTDDSSSLRSFLSGFNAFLCWVLIDCLRLASAWWRTWALELGFRELAGSMTRSGRAPLNMMELGLSTTFFSPAFGVEDSSFLLYLLVLKGLVSMPFSHLIILRLIDCSVFLAPLMTSKYDVTLSLVCLKRACSSSMSLLSQSAAE